MSVDFQELRELLTVIANTDITEFTLKSDDFELTLRKGLVVSPSAVTSIPQALPTTSETPTTPLVESPVVTPAVTPETSASPPIDQKKLLDITSPMVGTFYRAPTPDDPPFVEIGDRIAPGQTVCILEAMKLMNELEAEVSGQIVEIVAQNGEPVEFGQVLMRVDPG
ncbi:MAG: acetyl-CoA carboxylase biotin carboxyl carrier protein [Xenococcus sp. MO_188.B8]|nr:acetyl-CoA carboxylase biotin carboxyl carrier protein [Xenococcus sp. MO_188.B8]